MYGKKERTQEREERGINGGRKEFETKIVILNRAREKKRKTDNGKVSNKEREEEKVGQVRRARARSGQKKIPNARLTNFVLISVDNI